MTPPVTVSDLGMRIDAARAEGRYREAEAFCREAIDLEPENAALRVWLGWIALDRKAYADAISAAYEAGALADRDPVAVARLLVYAAAARGDWATADAALTGLDDDVARTLAIETGPIFLSCLQAFQRDAAWEDAVRTFSHVPQALAVATPDVMRDLCAVASTCHLALGQADTAITLFGQAMEPAPAVSNVSRQGGPPLLVTSLMPSRFEVQKAAIASWCGLGFDVVSLNAVDEIDTLRSEFPDVTFHPAKDDAKEQFGRPLVYVDEMLAILAASKSRIGGIINSDIVFASDADTVVGDALALAEQALIFGNRVDIDRPDADGAASQVYLFGYDWFLFRTDRATRMAGGGMVLGAPWWDLWLPLRAKLLGFDVVNVREPVARHEVHAMRWRQRDLEDMGRILARTLVAAADGSVPTRFGDRVTHVATLLEQSGPQVFSDRRFLDRLASLLRGLVQLEAIPFGAEGPQRITPFWNARGEI